MTSVPRDKLYKIKLSDFIELDKFKETPDPTYYRNTVNSTRYKLNFFKFGYHPNIRLGCVKQEYNKIFKYLKEKDQAITYYLTMCNLYRNKGVLEYIENHNKHVMVCDLLYYLINYPEEYEKYKHVNSNINEIISRYDMFNPEKRFLFKIIINNPLFRKDNFFPCEELNSNKLNLESIYKEFHFRLFNINDIHKDFDEFFNRLKKEKPYYYRYTRAKIFHFLNTLIAFK